jgi:hypothetical protein
MAKNFRELSKENWGHDNSIESINAGSFQRIADASELMAKNHREMQASIESMEIANKNLRKRNEDLWISNYHLRGHITRLKNKLKNR